jgi:hypothetical protein
VDKLLRLRSRGIAKRPSVLNDLANAIRRELQLLFLTDFEILANIEKKNLKADVHPIFCSFVIMSIANIGKNFESAKY